MVGELHVDRTVGAATAHAGDGGERGFTQRRPRIAVARRPRSAAECEGGQVPSKPGRSPSTGQAVGGVAGFDDDAGPAGVRPGVVEDVVAVGTLRLYAHSALMTPAGAGADPGMDQVVGGGEDRVGVVVDVAAAVLVAVDAVGGEAWRA